MTIFFYAEGEKDGILVEVAFQHNDSADESIHTFVNNINTSDGGTHLIGFKSGMTKTINDYSRKAGILKENDKNLTGDDVREGLAAIVSIKVAEPQFEGQTKSKLGNSEAKGAVESVINEYLSYFLEENPAIGRLIVEKGILASRAREAAKRARELVRRKSVLETLDYLENWQTVLIKTPKTVKYILWKETLLVVLQKEQETKEYRLYYR